MGLRPTVFETVASTVPPLRHVHEILWLLEERGGGAVTLQQFNTYIGLFPRGITSSWSPKVAMVINEFEVGGSVGFWIIREFTRVF